MLNNEIVKNKILLNNLLPSISISVITIVLLPFLISGINLFLIVSTIILSIILFSFTKIIKYLLKELNKKPVFIKLNYILIFISIIFYANILFSQLITLFSQNSLYYLTVNNIVARDSSFVSRIGTYFIPESIFIVIFSLTLISFVQLKGEIISKKFFFKSDKDKNLYQNLLLTLLFLQISVRMLSASLTGIISLLIIIYTVLVNFSNFSFFKIIDDTKNNLNKIFLNSKLNLKFIFALIITLIFLLSISFLSKNRGGDFSYLFNQIPKYIEKTFIYSNDLFDFFKDGDPAYCGLQSNIILYFFNPKPISICLENFKSSLFNSGLLRDGAWLGLFGAHLIDYGSFFSIFSVLITLGIYYYFPKLILKLPLLKNFRKIFSVILVIYYNLTISFLFTGFISANYLMIVFSLSNIFILKNFRLYKIYNLQVPQG